MNETTGFTDSVGNITNLAELGFTFLWNNNKNKIAATFFREISCPCNRIEVAAAWSPSSKSVIAFEFDAIPVF
jgi:hypothetical protein